MKRITIFSLALLLFITSLASPVMAYEQIRQKKEIVAQHRRGGPPRRRPPPPPPPRRHNNRDRRRHDDRDWIGFGIGAALGAAIGAGVANSNPAPREPVLVYDPACNCYYYR